MILCPVPGCNRRFHSKADLKEHLRRRHPNYKPVPSPKKEEDKDEPLDLGYDLDTVEKDTQEMKAMTESLRKLVETHEAEEEASIVDPASDEYYQALMRTQQLKERGLRTKSRLERKGVPLTKLKLLSGAEEDGKKVENYTEETRLELIDKVVLKDQNLGSVAEYGAFRPSDLKSLSYLDLSGNFLTSVAAFEYCFKLEFLDVSDNMISDLKGFEYCQGLKVVKAGKNKFKSLNYFEKLDALEELDLAENEVYNIAQSVESLKKMNSLKSLVLRGNPVSSIFGFLLILVVRQVVQL